MTHRKETMENDMPKLVSVVRPRRSSCVRRGGRAKAVVSAVRRGFLFGSSATARWILLVPA